MVSVIGEMHMEHFYSLCLGTVKNVLGDKGCGDVDFLGCVASKRRKGKSGRTGNAGDTRASDTK